MDYLYLMLSVVSLSSTGVICGFYNRRTAEKKDVSAIYGFIELCTVFVFWCVMTCFNGGFDISVLPYSALFAVFFSMAMVGRVFAIKEGSVVLTSLFIQISLVAVSMYGIIFWGTPLTLYVAAGLVLVVISVYLCLNNGKQQEGEKRKITLKWVIFSLIAFVGNAGCTIVQKTQQMDFEGKFGNSFMAVASAVSVLVGLMLYLKSDRTDSKVILKTNGFLPVLSGIGTGALNVFVMILATSALSPTLIYPTLAVGGLILTSIVSVFLFKEKLRWQQWLGVALGIAATVILSV